MTQEKTDARSGEPMVERQRGEGAAICLSASINVSYAIRWGYDFVFAMLI